MIKLNQDDELIDYFSTFKGDNVLDKFINILREWDNDVASTISINSGEKAVNVSIDYILDNIPKIEDNIEIKDENFEMVISIPEKFEDEGFLPIYSILKSVTYNGFELKFHEMTHNERKQIIDKFPASFYNKILEVLIKNKNYVVSFDNPTLSKLKFNFLTNEPFMFLKGLFNSYSDDYFRDIVYHLSSKIDGNLLNNATMVDIEYWIKKMSEDNKEA